MAQVHLHSNLNGNGLHPTAVEKNTMELLDNKRQQLDKEIADFKDMKEKEYRRLERDLLNKCIDNNKAMGPGESTFEDGEAASRKAEELSVDNGRSSRDALGATDQAQAFGRSIGLSIDQGDILRGVDPEAIQDVGRGTLVISARRPGQDTLYRKASLDRDLEFRGVFTPHYLPLLDSTGEVLRQAKGSNSTSPSNEPTDLETKSRDATPTLSSSATLPATIPSSNSPRHMRPLSASVPRPKALRERRSSSRSDTSITSLRSSLRDPKQPRSPKHVLFSIDNIVVAPSTSPIAQRSHAAPHIPFSGLTDMPEAAMREHLSHRDLTSRAQQVTPIEVELRKTSLRHLPLGAGTSNTFPSSSSITSYHHLLEPTITSPTTRANDFEHVAGDDDPLFAFDEDVDLREADDVGNSNVCLLGTIRA